MSVFPKLNLPTEYTFKIKTRDEGTQIFDEIRKKYVVLTPEEWVRQNLIQHLIREKEFPASLFAIEMKLSYNRLKKRGDVLVYDTSGKPLLLMECKAPHVKITQDAFDQIARYNMPLKVKYLLVSNGLNHYCCQMDYENANYLFVNTIPQYNNL